KYRKEQKHQVQNKLKCLNIQQVFALKIQKIKKNKKQDNQLSCIQYFKEFQKKQLSNQIELKTKQFLFKSLCNGQYLQYNNKESFMQNMGQSYIELFKIINTIIKLRKFIRVIYFKILQAFQYLFCLKQY
ncbi:hypothetical protein IMG5_039440, partial [Ichthyophthirius multifiliis]